MHKNSAFLFEKYAVEHFRDDLRVLEIGPDGFPSTFQRLVDNSTLNWETLDLHDNASLTYQNSDPYSFEIPDNTFDVVLSGNVIEHVARPWVWLPELARVVKPDGLVITVTPVSWKYHIAPIDCWRIYPDGMNALYEDANLEVIVSVWESLETPQYKRFVPGISLEYQSRNRRILNKIYGLIGLPVERAYDTIAIGKKKN